MSDAPEPTPTQDSPADGAPPATSPLATSPPNRLCSNPKSPFFDQAALERGVGVRFKGVEKNNVDEYCVSEGWVRLTVGSTTDRFGNPMTMKLSGAVEPYFKDKV